MVKNKSWTWIIFVGVWIDSQLTQRHLKLSDGFLYTFRVATVDFLQARTPYWMQLHHCRNCFLFLKIQPRTSLAALLPVTRGRPVFWQFFSYLSAIYAQYLPTKPPWACLVDDGTSFDTPGVPGGTFISKISWVFFHLFLIFLSGQWFKIKSEVTFDGFRLKKKSILPHMSHNL